MILRVIIRGVPGIYDLSSLMSSEAEKKLVEIGQACTNNDLTRLRELAISPGGFVIDDVRRKACEPILQFVTG